MGPVPGLREGGSDRSARPFKIRRCGATVKAKPQDVVVRPVPAPLHVVIRGFVACPRSMHRRSAVVHAQRVGCARRREGLSTARRGLSTEHVFGIVLHPIGPDKGHPVIGGLVGPDSRRIEAPCAVAHARVTLGSRQSDVPQAGATQPKSPRMTRWRGPSPRSGVVDDGADLAVVEAGSEAATKRI